MASSSTKVGHGLAKGLGINVNYRNDATENLSRGESVISSISGDNYVEREPTVGDWWRSIRPTGQGVKHYIRELFPFLNWITRYNTTWLTGDLIAGITVGFVVVPQGMAYALLAKLPAEYGLYTSFVGFLLYWAFATSKDITIGTVAVMSQLVGNIVIKVQKKHPDIPAEEIARSLAVIAGSVILAIGLTRTGWIVEWISLPAITAFMTGSAITIAAGQVPNLLGIPNVNTRGAGYRVIIDTLKALPNARIDAALGMSALVLLYGIRMFFSYLTKKQPQRKKLWFFLSTLRIAFVLLLYILISWTMTRGVKDAKKARIKILGTVPRGFKHAGAPPMNSRTISAFASDLPATIIVLLIEHIAISKSFGRINNYTINPSQELVAIGFSNVLGPFLGAYPATGSFSRTAIKSKAGVRTPLAGIFTAILVLLALYALTSMFFYIPSSALAAIIIHAVGDLITPPKTVYQFWEVSPIEVPVFFLGVFVSIFSNIENGIYATMGASAGIILFRFSKAQGRFLGKAKVRNVNGTSNLVGDEKATGGDSISGDNDANSTAGHGSREIFLPLDRSNGLNPEIALETPQPGVFVFRFDDGFNYPNSQHYFSTFTDHIFANTRRTTMDTYAKLGDRPWNDPGPRRGEELKIDPTLPILKAVILDFSAVNQVDVSSIQNLVDVRNQLDRYAAPSTVSWHFANIVSPWTRRSLAAAGFGYPKYNSVESRWRSVIAVGDADEFNHIEAPKVKDVESNNPGDDIAPEKTTSAAPASSRGGAGKTAPLYGVNRPFFHVDVQAALESAIAIVEQQEHQGST